MVISIASVCKKLPELDDDLTQIHSKSPGSVTLEVMVNIGLSENEVLHSMPIGSMYGIYANIGGILMVNVIIYSIHGSYRMV